MVLEMTRIPTTEGEICLKCDLNVLEKIQEEFGSLVEFERLLKGVSIEYDEDGNEVRKNVEIDLKTMKKGAYLMAVEAADIKGEHLTLEEFRRSLGMAELSLYEIAEAVYTEFGKCFVRKNSETTQKEAEEKMNR